MLVMSGKISMDGQPGMALQRGAPDHCMEPFCCNGPAQGGGDSPMTRSENIYLVDDDPAVLDALGMFLETEGYNVMQFTAASDLLDAVNEESQAVLVLDHYLDDMCGLDLQAELVSRGIAWPVIFISGSGDIALSVKAMKAGALDFLEKPVSNGDLLASVESAIEMMHEFEEAGKLRELAEQRYNSLSEREKEVMKLIVAGHSNSQVAKTLGLSVRTVEVHRSNINKKMQTHTLVELVRMADHCAWNKPENLE